MQDEIKVSIDSNSCEYLRIDPEKYKERMSLAASRLPYAIEIAIDRQRLISDGIFPLAISRLSSTSRNQKSDSLKEFHSIATAIFRELAAGA